MQLTEDETNVLLTDIKFGLGEDKDLNAFYAVARGDDVLSAVMKDLYSMRVGRRDDLSGRIILVVTLQMAPLKRSENIIAKLLEEYGTRLSSMARR